MLNSIIKQQKSQLEALADKRNSLDIGLKILIEIQSSEQTLKEAKDHSEA